MDNIKKIYILLFICNILSSFKCSCFYLCLDNEWGGRRALRVGSLAETVVVVESLMGMGDGA